MADVLAEICRTKRDEIERARIERPRDVLEADASAVPPPRAVAIARGELAVFAEVKRASPSAGAIATSIDAPSQAQSYADAGATAVSVLTDADYFEGSLDDLRAVRGAVDVPLLRKDFIIDPYQVPESRAAGADIMLLIVAALDAGTLVDLAHLIRSFGMTPLVEVHDRSEVPAACDALGDGGILGVNARNLKTLDVDVGVWEAVAADIPDDMIRIAESGIRSPADALRARDAGYDGVLCGEALMRAEAPGEFIAELRRAEVRR